MLLYYVILYCSICYTMQELQEASANRANAAAGPAPGAGLGQSATEPREAVQPPLV